MIEVKPPKTKSLEEIKELFKEYYGYDDEIVNNLVFFDAPGPQYIDAIIGVSEDHCVVYSYDKMVESAMHENNWTYEEAVEFIEFNAIRSLPYVPSLTGSDRIPIIVHNVLGLNN